MSASMTGAGLVDGRPAALVRDPGDPSGAPLYFVLLEWAGDRLASIRDFATRATRPKARSCSCRVNDPLTMPADFA